ncbi:MULTISPECIES: nuclear transport factor 2 family protein [unclassified Nocardioides]|uniref:nuclear transport factor 2 family protein n=1 Tax=unclassified Nocardioides TaxID=2615069 RepID=UPI0036186FF1
MTAAQPASALAADLTRLAQDSAAAYIRGDIDTYLDLIDHDDDFTLMSPFGGPTVRGFVDTPEAREETRRFFARGGATVEVEQVLASGDLAVLVLIERQHGEVGGTPDQDWSLRVTLVLRCEPSGWVLVHRHADALVHPISFDVLGVLARGESAELATRRDA